MATEKGILAQVKILHDDGIVDMTHLVHIIESNLYRCCVHFYNGITLLRNIEIIVSSGKRKTPSRLQGDFWRKSHRRERARSA